MVDLVSVGVLLALTFYKRSSKMRVFFYPSTPSFFGIFVQTYLTAHYAREGQYDFVGDGADADFHIMQEQGSSSLKKSVKT